MTQNSASWHVPGESPVPKAAGGVLTAASLITVKNRTGPGSLSPEEWSLEIRRLGSMGHCAQHVGSRKSKSLSSTQRMVDTNHVNTHTHTIPVSNFLLNSPPQTSNDCAAQPSHPNMFPW